MTGLCLMATSAAMYRDVGRRCVRGRWSCGRACPTVPVDRGDAGEGGEFAPSMHPSSGIFGEEGAGSDVRRIAGDGLRSSSFSRQAGRVLDAGTDDPVGVEVVPSPGRRRGGRSSWRGACLSVVRRRRLASMPIISTIWRRRATSSASRGPRAPNGPGVGPDPLCEQGNRLRVQSIRLGQATMALAKSRIWRGLTTHSGSPAPARAGGDGGLKATGGLKYDQGDGQAGETAGELVEPLPSRGTQKASPTGADARRGDPSKCRCRRRRREDRHDPTLRMRARARAAVRGSGLRRRRPLLAHTRALRARGGSG